MSDYLKDLILISWNFCSQLFMACWNCLISLITQITLWRKSDSDRANGRWCQEDQPKLPKFGKNKILLFYIEIEVTQFFSPGHDLFTLSSKSSKEDLVSLIKDILADDLLMCPFVCFKCSGYNVLNNVVISNWNWCLYIG